MTKSYISYSINNLGAPPTDSILAIAGVQNFESGIGTDNNILLGILTCDTQITLDYVVQACNQKDSHWNVKILTNDETLGILSSTLKSGNANYDLPSLDSDLHFQVTHHNDILVVGKVEMIGDGTTMLTKTILTDKASVNNYIQLSTIVASTPNNNFLGFGGIDTVYAGTISNVIEGKSFDVDIMRVDTKLIPNSVTLILQWMIL